jgi:hypothetical protein
MQTEFGTLMTEAGTQFDNLSGFLDSTSSDKLSAVKDLFLETILGELGSQSGALGEAMSVLEGVGQAGQQLMEGGLGELINGMQGVIDVIDAIKPVLEAVDSLLG